MLCVLIVFMCLCNVVWFLFDLVGFVTCCVCVFDLALCVGAMCVYVLLLLCLIV